jgi:hypothetical protein
MRERFKWSNEQFFTLGVLNIRELTKKLSKEVIKADPKTIDDFLARVIFLGPGITKIVLQSDDKSDSSKNERLRAGA